MHIKLLIKSSLLAKKFLFFLCIAFFAGCSGQYTWDEEVLLNTGETIWIKRQVEMKYKGKPGNPLDISYSPTSKQSMHFTYEEKDYYYEGDVSMQLLAVSPEKTPILVAPFGRANNYKCINPSYVQFAPKEDGQEWYILKKIEPWLYNIPSNLEGGFSFINKNIKTITMKRKKENMIGLDISQKIINPEYVSLNCISNF